MNELVIVLKRFGETLFQAMPRIPIERVAYLAVIGVIVSDVNGLAVFRKRNPLILSSPMHFDHKRRQVL
jgi:hypothetical protein